MNCDFVFLKEYKTDHSLTKEGWSIILLYVLYVLYMY